jgi:multiple antibiotic resistance protein
VNPLGSALVFLGLVGLQPPGIYKSLARQIAINMVLFFELIGSYLLSFFGISLPIVQLAGGVVVAAIGWGVLNKPDSDKDKESAAQNATLSDGSERWAAKTFYPLMFPITAGPGCLVVMLTLSAHTMESNSLTDTVLARAGLMLAVVLLSVLVYASYAYAPQITAKISPSTTHGILRVVAFILLCIGVQIAWNGLEALLTPLIHSR